MTEIPFVGNVFDGYFDKPAQVLAALIPALVLMLSKVPGSA
jgi:hypothetical protein